VIFFERAAQGTEILPEAVHDLDDPAVEARVGQKVKDELLEALELVEEAGDDWSVEDYLAGELSPFFFGSAMTNFGVRQILEGIGDLAPPPTGRPTIEGTREPADPQFSGFIFKIQANMNPRHRDRIAFMRVVSGQFERNMEVSLASSGKKLRLSKPHTFMAAERSIVEEAVPGDIVGLYDPGELRIGDTLYAGNKVEFQGIPRFAPEHFARIRLKDPTRRKHLQNGLTQLSQEGTVQLFYRAGLGQADPYVGAVGLLQFEVLKERLANEYNTKAELEGAPFQVARWVSGKPEGLAWLQERPDFVMVEDRYGHPVVLSGSPWSLEYAVSQAPGLELLDISPL
jgi:peptide chain release factor 3